MWADALPDGVIVNTFVDVNSPTIWEDCYFKDVQPGARNMHIRGGATIKRCVMEVAKEVAVPRQVVFTVGGIIEDLQVIANYGDASAALPAGEATIFERDGAITASEWRGKNTITGDGIAYSSRSGLRNMQIRRDSRTVDLPSVAAGATRTSTLAAWETRPGDLATVQFSQPLNGLIMSWVTNNHEISVTFFNPTAAAIKLLEGVLTGESYPA